jgi:nicotinamidase-related amidase
MENHPGVMASRKDRLRAAGYAEDKLDDLALDVLTMPFDDILLKEIDGKYRAVAFKSGNEWLAVDTDDDGYITKIRSELANPELIKNTVLQTLWRKHCVQGTESALFDDDIMAELPTVVAEQVRNDTQLYCIQDYDQRGNSYYVIRKGMNSHLDSYGIATENDGISKTVAPGVFKLLAQTLKIEDCNKANIYIGGLATNFCVEYSHNDVYKYLVPELQSHGIDFRVYFLKDISAGIPLEVPGGAWPDLDASFSRMAAFGTKEATTDDVNRSMLSSAQFSLKEPEPEEID